MLLPEEFAWAGPVAMAAVAVLAVSWIGNAILPERKLLAALAAAFLVALVLAPLAYFRIAELSVTLPDREPAPTASAESPSSSTPPANPVRTVPAE